jgi:hypothetical protein
MGEHVGRAALDAVTPRRESDIVVDGQVRKQAVILEGQDPPGGRSTPVSTVAKIWSLSRIDSVGGGQTGEHPQQLRLAYGFARR